MHPVTPERSKACETTGERLPWYVNGTLSPAERSAVEAHCRECARCAEALRLERKVVETMQSSATEVCDAETQAAWARFEARLGPEMPPEHRGFGLQERRRQAVRPERSRRASSRVAIQVILAAQAIAIAALAVLLYVERAGQEVPRFRTLTDADPTLALDRPIARVAFDARMSDSEVAALATRLGATIVAGPGANNVYTFAFEPGSDVDGKVARLRREEHVLLAEPVQRGAGR